MASRVIGVVVGGRKCGTTWLYENFRADPDVCVSHKVKESGFFASVDDNDVLSYERLYSDKGTHKVEVDSSLIYSDISAEKIRQYNPAMKVALVLREPVDYAVSRYIQARRKGELSSDNIVDSMLNTDLFRSELDYPRMLRRYRSFQTGGALLVVPFCLLQKDAENFYRLIKRHLVGETARNFEPSHDRVNVARQSRWSVVTSTLSRAAILARNRRLHFIVNFVKNLGIHKLLDSRLDNGSMQDLRNIISDTVLNNYPGSAMIYSELERRFADD